MKIDIFIDFACPFCFIGHNQLIKAIEELEIKNVEIMYYPKLLNNQVYGDNIIEVLINKFGISKEQVDANLDGITNRGKTMDLVFNFDKLKVVDSKEVFEKILSLDSKTQTKIIDDIFVSYYGNGNCLDQMDLAPIFMNYGFIYDEIENTKFNFDDLYLKYEVTTIPTYVFNDEKIIRESNTKENYIKMLKNM